REGEPVKELIPIAAAIALTSGRSTAPTGRTSSSGRPATTRSMLGGDDLVCGGLGNDTIHGGEGADTIIGDTGAFAPAARLRPAPSAAIRSRPAETTGSSGGRVTTRSSARTDRK